MKFYNEFKEEIPSDIVHNAEDKGCYSVKYIYIKGKKYRSALPATNLNINKESRPFRNYERARDNEELLGSFEGIEWVVYKSPKDSTKKNIKVVE